MPQDIELAVEPDPCARCGGPVRQWGDEYCPLCLGIVMRQLMLITPPARAENPLRPVPVEML